MLSLLKYTLARLGLFAVVLIALLPIPNVNILLKMMIAIMVSLPASYFLLKRMRAGMEEDLARRLQRRREEKEKLRTALAGEEEADKPIG